MKILFVTGIAGSGKPAYLKEFEEFCHKNKKSCKVISIGDLIFKIADEIGLKIREEKILNLPRSTLRTLISLALERCLKEYSDEDVVVISTHASYWWKTGPELAFDISFLNKLNPDMYVTIIDDCLKIRDRIYSDPKWGKDIISLEEIFFWQELEIYTTEIFALLQKKNFYVIHREHGVQTLFNIVFNENALKIYLSYPMTAYLNFPQYFKKANDLVKKLRRYCIVFDPILMEDTKQFKNKRLEEIAVNWTVRRDYRFIEQSDKALIYFPKIVHSPGVEKEMAYAHNSNKEVWLVCKQKRKSPFVTYFVDRFFKNVNEVIKVLKEINKKRKVKIVY
jgi:adenylate kinase